MSDNTTNRMVLLPNLITTGNAVCGFVALTLIAGSEFQDGVLLNPERIGLAAWLIFIGMIFDMLDGKIARLTGGTSNFGAQLDSLADLVTFGIAPAGLLIALNRAAWPEGWQKVAWVMGLAYFLGAILRLARFNAEHEEAEDAHMCFKGIPTPAAAGAIAGMVLVYIWMHQWSSWELKLIADVRPDWALSLMKISAGTLPFVGFLLGLAMVSSKLIYPHMASQYLSKKSSFDTFASLLFVRLLVALTTEPILCLSFFGYMLWTPIAMLLRQGKAKPLEHSDGHSQKSING